MRTKEEKKIDNFRIKLGLKLLDVTITKEKRVHTEIVQVFTRGKILQQHKLLKCYIDLYFPDYQLAIEADEKGNQYRDDHKEEERENIIKQELKCEFIRINPDREHLNIYTEIGRIYNRIIETKAKTNQKNINRQD